MQELTRDLVVYVLTRTDLPSLNSGKAQAQVHHTAIQMATKHAYSPLVQAYVQDGITQGADHFNTTIVLGATLEQINTCVQAAGVWDQSTPETVVLWDVVQDPSYPFFVENEEIARLIPHTETVKVVKTMPDGRVLMVRPEVTCAWFLGCRTNTNFRALFDGLDLHP